MRGAAVITGGAIQLGKALALRVARLGHDVALHYHGSTQEAQDTARQIRELGRDCELYRADLTEEQQLLDLVPAVLERFPSLSLLINSAAVYDEATLLDTEPDVFERQLRLTVKAPFFLTRDFARHTTGEGIVINVVDTKIAFQQPIFAAYLLAKSALAQLTKLAAQELGPRIRVNGLLPGFIMLPPQGRPPGYLEWRASKLPLGRTGALEEVAQAMEFLIENRFVTGS